MFLARLLAILGATHAASAARHLDAQIPQRRYVETACHQQALVALKLAHRTLCARSPQTVDGHIVAFPAQQPLDDFEIPRTDEDRSAWVHRHVFALGPVLFVLSSCCRS